MTASYDRSLTERQEAVDLCPAGSARPTGPVAKQVPVGSESGQSLAEYALIVALIVIVALVALTFFGTQINDILSIISDQING
jgi:Flp pilus assembly pilin Flp